MEPSQAGAGQASTPDDILTGLTDSQREAVLHSQGPLLVIAGPGAGKTRVIAHRVAYFVRSGQVNPADILARENELPGDKRDLILKYIGYEYLL